ncbi:hypothetical protein BGZ58_002298 [Dissophora ornata]|nr:hypothetical protein BGZ58_002298 [Dissophora ornata]
MRLQVPALYSTNISDDMPSLGLTGDTAMDDALLAGDQITPRKRIRGERIVWTPEEDEYLRRAVQVYGDKTEKWAKIAACVPGRTNKNCRKRWFHSLDPSLRKGGWTEEEDHLLRTGVQKFRGQWSKIAERIQGRTDDQCAKRWRESLDPDIDRAAWTPEDDMLLLQKFEEYGTQWQRIALSFPGRPGLHCRNRWRKIQRSLNHMERANKRRRNHMSILEGQSGAHKSGESGSGQGEGSGRNRQSSLDDALLHDSFLDDKYSLLEDSVDIADEKNDSNPDEERPYGCAIPDCKFESSSPSLLFYHFKASHHGTTVLKPFRCTIPGCEDRKRYKNINGLQYHVTHAKNTAGHSGHGSAQQDTQQGTASSSGTKPEDIKISAACDTLGAFTASTINSTSNASSTLPTPAEIQSLIPPPMPQPLVTHQAFNIPHTPETLEEPLMPSPMSLDISLPQPRTTTLQCPELGCGQIFHVLSGLTAHMANNHGHQSITMKSNDMTFGPDSIAIPENNFDDIDIDMDMDLAYLASESSSPMETASLLLMDDAQLQLQLDRLTRDHGALSLDPTSPDAITAQEMDILSMNELLFANHIANSLNNINLFSSSNRIHFGTHINVSANDDTLTFPATPVTSANVSPRMMSINIPADDFMAPATIERDASASGVVPGAVVGGTAVAAIASSSVKKFQCVAADCPKSYGSNSAMRAHVRHEHPDIYTKPGKTTGIVATTPPPTTDSGMGLGTSSVSAPGSPDSPESLASSNSRNGKQQKQSSKKVDDGAAAAVAGKPFKCLVPGCGKGYTNINGLKNHLLQAHGSMPPKKGVTAIIS